MTATIEPALKPVKRELVLVVDYIPDKYPDKFRKNQLITDNDKIIRLIEIIANNHLSVKEMIAAIGLRDRKNFMEYSLTPAIKEGFVTLLYPDKPRHPRQKYLLTVKGMTIFGSLR